MWQAYNAETSYGPFLLPLSVWIAMYTWGKWHDVHFHKWLFMQNLHNISAVVLGLLSLYYDQNDILNERTCILFNLSYFTLDFIDCLVRKDMAYTAHAFFCLALGVCNYTTPTLRTLRMNSKACLFEVSSPFLHVAQRTHNPKHFALFVAVFTVCRMIWIPILCAQLYRAGHLPLTDFRQFLLYGFYTLNCYWYYKMIRIVTGAVKKSSTTSSQTEKKID